MPIHTGQDKNGSFYQWGKTGKKYYFKPGDETSRKRAQGKAEAQQTAIYSSGWKGDNQMMKLLKVKYKKDLMDDIDDRKFNDKWLKDVHDIADFIKKLGDIGDKLDRYSKICQFPQSISWNDLSKNEQIFVKEIRKLGQDIQSFHAYLNGAISQIESIERHIKKI